MYDSISKSAGDKIKRFIQANEAKDRSPLARAGNQQIPQKISVPLREIKLTQDYIPEAYGLLDGNLMAVHGEYVSGKPIGEQGFVCGQNLGIGRIGSHAWVDPATTSGGVFPLIVFGEFEDEAYGVVGDSDIEDGRAGAVNLWWKEYARHSLPGQTNPNHLIDSGKVISDAWNHSGTTLRVGTWVVLRWSPSVTAWEIASTNLDERVKVSDSDATAGFLDDKIEGDGIWIDKETAVDPETDEQTLIIKHIGPPTDEQDIAATTDPVEEITSQSRTGGVDVTIKTNPLQTDEHGHAMFEPEAENGSHTITVLDDEIWTKATAIEGGVKIEHDGPDDEADGLDLVEEIADEKSGRIVTLTLNGYKIGYDARGHVTGLGDETSHEVEFDVGLDGVTADETWIHAEEADNVATISHIGPSEKTADIDPVTSISSSKVGNTVTLTLNDQKLDYDAKGHVTGEGTAGEHKVEFDVGAEVEADEVWIHAVNANNVATISHIGPSDEFSTVRSCESFVCGGGIGNAEISLTANEICFDARGHLTGNTTSTTQTITVGPGNRWIEVEGGGNGVLISHANVGEMESDYDPISSVAITKLFNTIKIEVVYLSIGRDAKGHIDEYTTTGSAYDTFELPTVKADEVWIHAETEGVETTISHIGPGEYADFYDPAVSILVNSSNELEISYYKGNFDAKGHFCGQGEQSTETASINLVKVTVVTGVQVSGLTVQIKTRDVYVLKADAESDWTTIHTGTECP